MKLSLAMIGVAALVLVGFLVFTGGGDDPEPEATPTGGSNAELLVRDDSPRLSEGGEAVFVEFLDFECEACLALYPVIEDLREEYGDRVTFVVRHMPLHGNSVNAALAAEAAAEQGEFEAMYHRLFETAEQWGHQEASQRETFFGYAEDLGLDMDRFESAYDDPATLERIEQSQQDGQALGVQGTPTFFLDGELLQPQSITDLEDAFDAALQD
ncbi:thioredoxin domain-containing protein [Nostocoides sp. F2B08]|uniref:DsbA family protein n=1 Tax=Nostocoides sp. F2B08 TaxID=2653936 RepID=UPI001D056A96|nr:thioredoxin domain-containing protein [Tetrasphaera sp. F2B08]